MNLNIFQHWIHTTLKLCNGWCSLRWRLRICRFLRLLTFRHYWTLNNTLQRLVFFLDISNKSLEFVSTSAEESRKYAGCTKANHLPTLKSTAQRVNAFCYLCMCVRENNEWIHVNCTVLCWVMSYNLRLVKFNRLNCCFPDFEKVIKLYGMKVL